MHRRDFLSRTVGASSLLAVGGVVPEFLANTAFAAEDDKAKKKDTILVVIELTGGNDGLNTVAPYADDLYQKARPTLAISKRDALNLDDYCGLHPQMRDMKQLFDEKKLAIVQGVGYPNPDRSHFESMDIWQLADPKRAKTQGWLARSIPKLTVKDAGVPGMYLGDERLPVAMQGADGGVISLKDRASFKLQLSGNKGARKSLIEDLNSPETGANADLAGFVRKRQLQTYASLKQLEEALNEVGGGEPEQFNPNPFGQPNNNGLNSLNGRLQLIGRLIQKGLGTRIYYVQHGGFDTHSGQADEHGTLLSGLSGAIGQFLRGMNAENADRVVVMTYSEFGRRVRENGSQGTDHGSGSCMFLAGNKVAGGLVGKHPSLSDLTDGDLKYHTDFRRVYATLLDGWLGVDSQTVLGDKFENMRLIDKSKKTEVPAAPEDTDFPPGSIPPPPGPSKR